MKHKGRKTGSRLLALFLTSAMLSTASDFTALAESTATEEILSVEETAVGEEETQPESVEETENSEDSDTKNGQAETTGSVQTTETEESGTSGTEDLEDEKISEEEKLETSEITEKEETESNPLKSIKTLTVEELEEEPSIKADSTSPANPVHHCTKKNDGTDYTDWSYVYFGSYPQSEVTGDALTAAITGAVYDNNGDAWVSGTKYRRIRRSDTNNTDYFGSKAYRYFKWERIKWRVLQNDGNTLFVVADKGLDCKNHNEVRKSITWENCTLREWLNNDFYGIAFSSAEQGAVVGQTVVNEDNPYDNAEGGNNTNDKVYLLSIGEVTNPYYGFCEDRGTHSASRWMQRSDFAQARGAYTYSSSDTGGNANTYWWLRSPYDDYDTFTAANVDPYGSLCSRAYNMGSYFIDFYTVAPALHINLSSNLWSLTDDGTSGAGGNGGTGDDGNAGNENAGSGNGDTGEITPPDNSSESTFDASLYQASYIYDFYQNTDSGMESYFNSDTPSKIINTEAEKSGLVTSAQAWKDLQTLLGAIDDPSNLLDKPFEKMDLYEGIIFSLFETASENSGFQGKDIIKDANSLLGVIKNDMNALYGIRIGEDNDISGLTKEQKEKLREVSQGYFKDKGIVKSAEVLSKISSAVDYIGDLQELCEYQSSCMAVMGMSEDYQAILQDMYELCPPENIDLKMALKECTSVMKMSEETLACKMEIHAIGVVGKEVAKCGISKLWGSVKEEIYASNPYAALCWASYKSSTYFCNAVFNTNDVAERTVKVAAMMDVRALVQSAYEREKSGFANSRVTGNAEKYIAAIDVNFKYLDEDCNAAYSFAEATSEGLLARLQAAFGKNDAEELKKQIKSIQNIYYSEYESTKTAWVYGLEADYPEKYSEYKHLLDESWNRIKKKYQIACPVNVYVYDASGKLVASVVNNVPYCEADAPFTVAAVDDEKEIWFYGDAGQYTVSYIGTDNGTMDITIEEYSASGDMSRQVKHTDVPLTNGKAYSSQENVASDSNTYELKENGTANSLKPTVDTADTSILKYTLTINNGYMVDGLNSGYTGTYCAGEKVTVYANVPEKAVWKGWKSDVPEAVFKDKTAKATTFTMPAKNVNVTAVYDIKTTKLKISAPSKKIAAGKKVQLTAKITPKNATNQKVTWKSSNKKYATVSSKGVVTTKKAGAGKTVTITAKAKDGSGMKASVKIKIMKNAVTKVKIKNAPKTLKVKKSITLKAAVSTNGKNANKTLKWTSSNSKYATVNSKGKVTAKKAGKGKIVTITAASTDGTDKKAKVKIKLK